MSWRPVREESSAGAGSRAQVRRALPYATHAQFQCQMSSWTPFGFPFKKKLGHIWLQQLPQALPCSHLPLETLPGSLPGRALK